VVAPPGTSEQTAQIGRKELGIIAHLHANRGTVLPRKALIHAVWGLHANGTSRSLDQYVVKVRELFRSHGLALDGFRTVHGIGYIFDYEDVAEVAK
jgi:DNA-binding response OmpR family regulator